MASLNKVMLIGNLGANPEIKTLGSGDKVASFRIATTESYKNKAGEKVEDTEWHNIEFWGGIVNVIEQYLKKGDGVYIEGRIKTDKYTDATGADKYFMKIAGNKMQMLGKRDNSVSGNEMTSKNTELVTEKGDDLPF